MTNAEFPCNAFSSDQLCNSVSYDGFESQAQHLHVQVLSHCRLQNIDVSSNTATLSKDGHQVTVDISTVSHETLKEDSLFQVIGELEHFDDQVSKVEIP